MTEEKPAFDENDEHVQRLLKGLDEDAAIPNRDVIADATKAAGEAFFSKSGTENRERDRGRNMMIFTKPAVLVAASVLVLLALFNFANNDAVGDVTFGEILEQALKSTTLQLKVTNDGKDANVWIKGGRVRWEDAPQKYRVAEGRRLWRVDETAGELREESNPWLHGEEQNLDLQPHFAR